MKQIDPETHRLMLGFVDADEAGDKVGYLNGLEPRERDKLLAFLVKEIGEDLKKEVN